METPVVQQPEPSSAELQRRQQAIQIEQQGHKLIAQLRIILVNAQQALADDRLMRPALNNAYYWYQQAIRLDELNAEAHWGMRQITARYLALAEQAFSEGRIDKAEIMLEGAGLVSATPSQMEQLRQRYRKQNMDRQFYLSMANLNARNETIKQELAQLARQAREGQSRLTIIARNDAEGRWIYQQMRTAVNNYRLRGNIQLGKNPRIVLIDL